MGLGGEVKAIRDTVTNGFAFIMAEDEPWWPFANGAYRVFRPFVGEESLARLALVAI